MKIYDWKYIFKKVLIFFIIFIILSFVRSCEVHAQTYSLSSKHLQTRYYPSGNWYTINWNQWITTTTDNSMYGIQMNFEPVYDQNYNYTPIGAGTYLLDFYIETNHLSDNLSQCNGISSDFRFEDTTTGNWVSASSSSSSSCLDSYYTTLGGNKAIHYLFQWQITDTQTYPYNASEIQFLIYNFSGSGFTIYNASYFMIMGSLQDYDPQIVANFKKLANDNANNQATINSINSGTQNIINNQEQNTQDIIDNQNSNTQQQIESQKVCQYIDKNSISVDNRYLNSSGVESYSGNFGVTDYISVNSSSDIKILSLSESSSYVCFYNVNYTLLSCVSSLSNGLGDLLIPNGSSYVRFTINKSLNKPTYNVCTNGNQALNDSINDLNDNINDDNVSGAESQVNDLLNNSAFQDNSGIQSIITAPLNFIQGLTNTCSPISLTIPFIDTNVSIPCMKQELTNRVPTIVPILSTIINGFIIYRILLDIVSIVKSAREPDEDRIEVLDL